ncbi:MAG: TolC family protein [bacterium]
MKSRYDVCTQGCILTIAVLAAILTLSVPFPSRCRAQAVRPLSLIECLDIALEQNPSVNAARERVLQSRLRIPEARASMLPRLSTSLEYTHQDGDTLLAQFFPDDNYGFSVSLQQPLFDQGKYLVLKPQAHLSIEISELEHETVTQNVLFGVVVAYLNTLKADEMLAIAREARERLTEHLRVTRRRFEVGQVAKNDVLRAEMELANAQSDLIHAEKALSLSYENLGKVIFWEEGPFTVLPVAGILEQEGEMEESINRAYERRPDYRAAVKSKELAGMGVTLAKRDFLPMVTLFGEYEKSGEDFFPDDETVTVGGSISLPLFEGGTRMVRLRRARHDHTLSGLQEIDQRKQVRLEVVQAFLRLDDLLATLKAIDKQIEHAQENMRIVKLRYQEGEATNLDVLDANLLLVKAKTDLATLNYDVMEARFAIDKAAGVLTGERIMERLMPD